MRGIDRQSPRLTRLSHAKRHAKPRRTAVLVIHGVGNQRPLETLRAAADALYATDGSFGEKPPLWLTFDRDNDEQDVDLPVLTTADIANAGEPAALRRFSRVLLGRPDERDAVRRGAAVVVRARAQGGCGDGVPYPAAVVRCSVDARSMDAGVEFPDRVGCGHS